MTTPSSGRPPFALSVPSDLSDASDISDISILSAPSVLSAPSILSYLSVLPDLSILPDISYLSAPSVLSDALHGEALVCAANHAKPLKPRLEEERGERRSSTFVAHFFRSGTFSAPYRRSGAIPAQIFRSGTFFWPKNRRFRGLQNASAFLEASIRFENNSDQQVCFFVLAEVSEPRSVRALHRYPIVNVAQRRHPIVVFAQRRYPIVYFAQIGTRSSMLRRSRYKIVVFQHAVVM